MIEVIGVRFKKAGKLYYFDPNGLQLKEGEHAIVETVRGVEYGTVIKGNTMVDDNDVIQPLKKVIRVATPEDDACEEENRQKEKEAFEVCFEKIAKHGLDMKLIDVEITFDHNKLIFYFTSDERVDFRELVKELATVFKTRIELRQIGVRDECKMKGGLGMCGRPFCCHSFMGDFHPVSIKMAKEQGLSLNPVKISGTCGRLMCCLNYEQEVYEELNRSLPRVGALIKTPDGNATVAEVNTLKQTVRAALTQKDGTVVYNTYNADSVRVLKGGKNIVSKEEQELLRELEDE